MSLAPVPGPGLPVVPRAAADELLGSWLLRVAGLYGMGLRDLLVRLAAMRPGGHWASAWYDLRADHLHLPSLAEALHRDVDSIATMAPPQCDRHWPAELGWCGQCLGEAFSAGMPPYWRRRWMHPLALACHRHRSWLEPVSTRVLRQVSHIDEISWTPRKTAAWTTLERRREAALVDGALWLEALVAHSPPRRPPWYGTDLHQFAQVLRRLVELLMAPAAANLIRHRIGRWPRELPERRQRWACQTFRLNDGVSGPITLAAPGHLRHRQFVVGLLGCYLRTAPSDRMPFRSLEELIARGLAARQLARWPPALAEWVVPRPVTPRPSKSRR